MNGEHITQYLGVAKRKIAEGAGRVMDRIMSLAERLHGYTRESLAELRSEQIEQDVTSAEDIIGKLSKPKQEFVEVLGTLDDNSTIAQIAQRLATDPPDGYRAWHDLIVDAGEKAAALAIARDGATSELVDGSLRHANSDKARVIEICKQKFQLEQKVSGLELDFAEKHDSYRKTKLKVASALGQWRATTQASDRLSRIASTDVRNALSDFTQIATSNEADRLMRVIINSQVARNILVARQQSVSEGPEVIQDDIVSVQTFVGIPQIDPLIEEVLGHADYVTSRRVDQYESDLAAIDVAKKERDEVAGNLQTLVPDGAQYTVLLADLGSIAAMTSEVPNPVNTAVVEAKRFNISLEAELVEAAKPLKAEIAKLEAEPVVLSAPPDETMRLTKQELVASGLNQKDVGTFIKTAGSTPDVILGYIQKKEQEIADATEREIVMKNVVEELNRLFVLLTVNGEKYGMLNPEAMLEKVRELNSAYEQIQSISIKLNGTGDNATNTLLEQVNVERLEIVRIYVTYANKLRLQLDGLSDEAKNILYDRLSRKHNSRTLDDAVRIADGQKIIEDIVLAVQALDTQHQINPIQGEHSRISGLLKVAESYSRTYDSIFKAIQSSISVAKQQEKQALERVKRGAADEEIRVRVKQIIDGANNEQIGKETAKQTQIDEAKKRYNLIVKIAETIRRVDATQASYSDVEDYVGHLLDAMPIALKEGVPPVQ